MKKRIALNSFFNVSAHFLRMLISVFMTPFLLSRLGAEVYSILPLINSLVVFLALASGGIQSSVARYATLSLARAQPGEANQYINTAFALLAGIMFLFTLPFLGAALWLPHVLTLPSGHEGEAQLVFMILGLNLFITMLASPFSIGIYARQRFEFTNIAAIVGQLIFVGVVVVGFQYFQPSILLIAVGMLVNTLVSSLASVWISMRLVPSIRFSPTHFARSKVKEILSYSFWTLVIQASGLLILNTDYLIINKCIDPTAVTFYSLAARFNELLSAVVTSAVRVITPACTELEARGAMAPLRSIFIRGLRILLFIILPPALLLSLFSRELLITWVGAEFVSAHILFFALLIPQILILGALPSNSILIGMGRVRYMGLLNLAGAVANIGLSLSLVLVVQMGSLGVALATSTVLTVKNLIFVPWYTSRVLKASYGRYLTTFIRPIGAALPLVLTAVWLRNQFDLTGWIPLLSASAFCTLVFIATAYAVAFEAEDKADLATLIREPVRRIKGLFSNPVSKGE